MGIGDGVGLMRASWGVVRRDPALLWFPLVSTVCLALTAGFWIVQGAYVYAANGSKLLFVPVVFAGIYSLAFVGVFFSVALAGAIGEALDDEGESSFNDGMNVAWLHLGAIASWAAVSILVAIAIGFVKSFKGLWLVGDAAQIAWSLATIFVVPLIAFDDLDATSARRRSFELAKENWRAETGGLGALNLAVLVPGLLIYVVARLIVDGDVHSFGDKALVGIVLLCGFGVAVTARVIRQVFAVELYRTGTTGGTASSQSAAALSA
jgi:Family of unknown function (DUF6159)